MTFGTTRLAACHGRLLRYSAALALLAAPAFLGGGSAQAAVVYCTGPGIPVGCVVRTAPAARAVVYCTRPGYPVGCVASPAPAARAVARPGPGVNAGGPVNYPGLR